jgi:hypothetical protein
MRATLLLISILLSYPLPPVTIVAAGVLLIFEAFHGEHHKQAAICYASPTFARSRRAFRLKTARFVAPLVLHELAKDPAKEWRHSRLAPSGDCARF